MPVALWLHLASLDAQPSAPLLLLVALKLSSLSPPQSLASVPLHLPTSAQYSPLPVGLEGWLPDAQGLGSSWLLVLHSLHLRLAARHQGLPPP